MNWPDRIWEQAFLGEEEHPNKEERPNEEDEADDVEGGERQQRLWPLPCIQGPRPLCTGWRYFTFMESTYKLIYTSPPPRDQSNLIQTVHL